LFYVVVIVALPLNLWGVYHESERICWNIGTNLTTPFSYSISGKFGGGREGDCVCGLGRVSSYSRSLL